MNALLIIVALALVAVLAYRARLGFGLARAVAQDDVTLSSERYRLIGRPDRVEMFFGRPVPVEKKSGLRLHPSHRAQVLSYCLLLEETYSKPPRMGVVVLGNGQRVKIPYGKKEREEIVALVARIHALRSERNATVMPSPFSAKCARCRHRSACAYRAA